MGQFLIQYIFVAIFNYNEKNNMSTSKFIDYMSTAEYQNKLTEYINSRALIIIAITMVILLPIFYTVYKKYKTKSNFKFKNLIVPILFGISISLIYNIVLFSLNNVVGFTNEFQASSLPLYVQIITSGILGPILEELTFRGVVYNKLKEFNKPMTAIILCSVIFGILHVDIINAIYAFGVSFILIYLYEKYKTIIAPIIMHISLNVTIMLAYSLIVRNILIVNISLIIVSVIILLILKKIIKKDV